MGPIPLRGDHDKAHRLYRAYQKLQMLLSYIDGETLEELWDDFVLNSTFASSSRVIAAFPPKDQYKDMGKTGIVTVKRKEMTRSLKWLEENGVCADTMTIGVSTIPQAGHGAFATRRLRQGTVVLPIPLIHIPDKSVFKMHDINNEMEVEKIHLDNRTHSGYQLLLNYALGHPESSLLLSPYGPLFPLINHNQTRANVRLQWASPDTSQHKPELLTKNISYLETVKTASLAMELVALRDIEVDEEILLDYGSDWEEAWQQHVQNWKPLSNSNTYISATMLNKDPAPIRTEFEQMENPYPENVMLLFHPIFRNREKWTKAMNRITLEEFAWDHHQAYEECEVLRYYKDEERYWYTLAVEKEDNPDETIILEGIPEEALKFFDRPYTADWSLPNAFRHEIHIPDSIFPLAWRNLKVRAASTGNYTSAETEASPVHEECFDSLCSEL